MTWISATDGEVPDTDREVEVETESGDVRTLRYDMGLWWLPDKSMYVYFWPVRWRELQ